MLHFYVLIKCLYFFLQTEFMKPQCILSDLAQAVPKQVFYGVLCLHMDMNNVSHRSDSRGSEPRLIFIKLEPPRLRE